MENCFRLQSTVFLFILKFPLPLPYYNKLLFRMNEYEKVVVFNYNKTLLWLPSLNLKFNFFQVFYVVYVNFTVYWLKKCGYILVLVHYHVNRLIPSYICPRFNSKNRNIALYCTAQVPIKFKIRFLWDWYIIF